MLEMQHQRLQEIGQRETPNMSALRELLENVRNHNKEITVDELLCSDIDFNVGTADEILQQVYVNIEFKNPLENVL